jgi:spermidine synthase
VVHEAVARAESERGEVVLRRGDDGVLELRVNGVFVMHTAESTTERLLARGLLDRLASPSRVLVGGLGLGYTLRELLTDSRVRRVVVAEIEPSVVGWMRERTLPGLDLLADPRVEVYVGDVGRLVPRLPPGGLDAVLLDIDNGPGHLVHDANAALYRPRFLRACRDALREGGQLAVWSADAAPELVTDLGLVFGRCDSHAVQVDLQGRAEQYWLLIAAR